MARLRRPRTTIRFLLSLAVVGGSAGSALAQTPTASSVDTAAIRIVLNAAVEALAADGLIPILPQPAQPWRIVTADSASPVWRAALAQLRVALQARATAPSDTLTRVLEFGSLRISSDTLSTWFTIGSEWRCRSNGARMSSSAIRRIIAVRPRGWWQPAQTVETTIGDPPPCG